MLENYVALASKWESLRPRGMGAERSTYSCRPSIVSNMPRNFPATFKQKVQGLDL